MILRENSVSDHFTPPLDPPWEGYFILTPPTTHKYFWGVSLSQGTDGIPGPMQCPKTSSSTSKKRHPKEPKSETKPTWAKAPTAPTLPRTRDIPGPQWVPTRFPASPSSPRGRSVVGGREGMKKSQTGSFVGAVRGLLPTCKWVWAALMGACSG